MQDEAMGEAVKKRDPNTRIGRQGKEGRKTAGQDKDGNGKRGQDRSERRSKLSQSKSRKWTTHLGKDGHGKIRQNEAKKKEARQGKV